MTALSPDDLALLAGLGIREADVRRVEPLTGGVSSVVLAVATDDREVVLKRALPELAVGDGWRADVRRSLTEVAYAHVLQAVDPESALPVLAVDEEHAAFAMERAPEAVSWKQELLDGRADPEVAARLGRLLGTVHRDAVGAEVRARFAGHGDLETLRIAPYFEHARDRHPGSAAELDRVIALVRSGDSALVHGDFSPKNVLVTPDRRVLLLDHEVAHWGEPAFDVAFLVSHLALKAVRRPAGADAYARAADAFLASYRAIAAPPDDAAATTGMIAAALLLARVDGRSPVEYLDDDQRARVRELARRLLAEPVPVDAVVRAAAP